MQHITNGGACFCIYSIRDEYNTLLKIQTCKSENIGRVLRFYKSKYPAYTVTPVIHKYYLHPHQDVKDLLKRIDNKLRPAPVYNHNYTPRANTIRLQKHLDGDFNISMSFIIKAMGDILHECNELDIYEDFHQQDETGDVFSYANIYNEIYKNIKGR